MAQDECILLDDADGITGHASKVDCHRFVPGQPTGRLHRAFSVFLFNPQGQLLLQQRAASKITFPNVWTNTCCSHPLYGQEPSEVDEPPAVEDGSVPGVKHAAVRKLGHELGVRPEQVPVSAFRFLTRLHYCAADTVTHGPESPWGEHEIDYILFARTEAVDLAPNPEEVQATRYVTREELRAMMHPDSGLLWSPWFRIMVDNFLDKWWEELDAAVGSDRFLETDKVHDLRTA